MPQVDRRVHRDEHPTPVRAVDPGGLWEVKVLPGVLGAGVGEAYLYELDPTQYLPNPPDGSGIKQCYTMGNRPSGPNSVSPDWVNVPTPDTLAVSQAVPVQIMAPLFPLANPVTPEPAGQYGWLTAAPNLCYFIELRPAVGSGAPYDPNVQGYFSPVFGLTHGRDVMDMDFCQDGVVVPSVPGSPALGGLGIGVWGRIGAEMACPRSASDNPG